MAQLSLEVGALVAYLTRTGVKFRVTATLGHYVDPQNPCDPHSPGSYHCKPGTNGPGLAIDVAGPSTGAVYSELLPIFATFASVESQLAELIYSGAPYSIKNGKRVPVGYGDPTILAAHRNHVHVAVNKGTFLVPMPIEGVTTLPDPVDPGVTGPPDYDLSGIPCSISAVFDSNGNVKGYYIMTNDGSVAAIGNIPYLGRVH